MITYSFARSSAVIHVIACESDTFYARAHHWWWHNYKLHTHFCFRLCLLLLIALLLLLNFNYFKTKKEGKKTNINKTKSHGDSTMDAEHKHTWSETARQTHDSPLYLSFSLSLLTYIWTFFVTTENNNNNNRSFYSRFGIIFSLFNELILLLLPLAHKADTNHKLYGHA